MTGPEHFHRAEELTAEAHKHLGHGEGQATAAVWAAVAQVHATLALAAAVGATRTKPSGPRFMTWRPALHSKHDKEATSAS